MKALSLGSVLLLPGFLCCQQSPATPGQDPTPDLASSVDLASGADLATNQGPDLSTGPGLWARRPPSTGNDQALAVAVDSAGSSFLTGYFMGNLDFGGGALVTAGDKDVFLARYAADGTPLWGKRFGAAGSDTGYAVATDAVGNVIVVGEFEGSIDFGGGLLVSAGLSDGFVAKFSPSGTHLWSKRFGSSSLDQAYNVTVDATGSILVTGKFYNTVDFGGGPLTSAGGPDIFLTKYAADGSYVFAKRFGGSKNDFSYHVATDTANNILLTGAYNGTVDFGGGPLTEKGQGDVFLVKLNASGAHVFSKSYGGIGIDYGASAAADSAGNIYLSGSFQNTVDFGGGPLSAPTSSDLFVAKYSATGAHLWSKSYGGTGVDAGQSVVVDKNDNLLLGGIFGGTIDFGGGPFTGGSYNDAFLTKFAPDGSHLWSRGFVGATFSAVNYLALDGSNNVFAVGNFSGTLDFGGGPLTSTSLDTFLLKRAP